MIFFIPNYSQLLLDTVFRKVMIKMEGKADHHQEKIGRGEDKGKPSTNKSSMLATNIAWAHHSRRDKPSPPIIG